MKSCLNCQSYGQNTTGMFFRTRCIYNRLDRIPACDRQTDGHLGTASRYGYPSRGEKRKSNTNAIHYKQNVTQENKHLDVIYA